MISILFGLCFLLLLKRHKNNEEIEEIELGEEETESLLKEYFKSLKEDDIGDAPCAESFMEFIFAKNFT